MPDVLCSTCDEPWDTHHLINDEIFDTNLSEEECIQWLDLPTSEKLSPWYRERFKQNGWEFGSTVINVIRCPACPKDAKTGQGRAETKRVLEELLGDDIDGITAIFEDYGL